jgi:hypothetical protein
MNTPSELRVTVVLVEISDSNFGPETAFADLEILRLSI